MTSITDPSSRTTTFQYDTNGRLQKITDSTNRQTYYTYDASGNLTSVTLAYGTSDAKTTYYGYDANHNLTSVTTPRGTTTYYYYTTDDRIQSINSINKVQNASMEVDSDGNSLPDLWPFWTGQTGKGFWDNSASHGSKSFRIDASSANTYNYSVYVSDPILVDTSKTYAFSGYLKASQTSGSQNTVLSLLAYDSASTYLGEIGRTDLNGAQANWQAYSSIIFPATFPAGTTTVKVKIAGKNTTGSGSSYFDGIQLEEGS